MKLWEAILAGCKGTVQAFEQYTLSTGAAKAKITLDKLKDLVV